LVGVGEARVHLARAGRTRPHSSLTLLAIRCWARIPASQTSYFQRTFWNVRASSRRSGGRRGYRRATVIPDRFCPTTQATARSASRQSPPDARARASQWSEGGQRSVIRPPRGLMGTSRRPAIRWPQPGPGVSRLRMTSGRLETRGPSSEGSRDPWRWSPHRCLGRDSEAGGRSASEAPRGRHECAWRNCKSLSISRSSRGEPFRVISVSEHRLVRGSRFREGDHGINSRRSACRRMAPGRKGDERKGCHR
jgi:hypothetical protein